MDGCGSEASRPPPVIITLLARPKLAHTVVKIEPFLRCAHSRAGPIQNVCYDPHRFCGLDFPVSLCETDTSILLLIESRKVIRTP